MKTLKKMTFALTAFIMSFPLVPVFAEGTVPPVGVERIGWAMRCGGKMPTIMVCGLIGLALMIIVTVFTVKSMGDNSK